MSIQSKKSKYKNKQWLEKKYIENGLTSDEISEFCTVSAKTILRHLKKNNIPIRDAQPKNTSEKKYKNEDWLHEKFVLEDLEQKEIANICNVAPQTIFKYVNRYNLEKEYKYHDEEWLENKYKNKNKTLSQIANECDVARQTIANWCEKHNIKISYPEGQNHPQFKPNGGKYPENKGGSWEKNRREALERANYACENPSCDENVESLGRNPDVHHIVPYKFKEKYDVNDLSNLIVLCRSCHIEAEPPKKDD